MSTPRIVYDLLTISSGDYFWTRNDSIGDAWESLTKVQWDETIDSKMLVDEYYSLFLKENDSRANSAMAESLGAGIRKARLDDSRSDSGYLDAVAARTAFELKVKGDLRSLLEYAEEVMDKRRKRDFDIEWNKTSLGSSQRTAISRKGQEPRSRKEALSSELSEDLALAFYFEKWLEAKKEDISKSGALKSLDESEYRKSILGEVENNIRNRNQDPNLGDTVLTAENKAASQRLIDTSQFDKQRYLIQNIKGLSDLSKARFSYNSSELFSSEQPAATASSSAVESNEFQWIGIAQNRILRFTKTQKNAVGKISGAALGKNLFKLSNMELSKLVPVIRVWKLHYNEKMEEEGEVEIKFPTRSEIMKESMFDADPTFAREIDSQANPYTFPKTRRGYGIRSFSWEYAGSDPFSVDRDISATLELYFQDFSQFTATRGSGENSYRYLDLVSPRPGVVGDQTTVLGEVFQQDIKISAGWQVPNTFSEAQKESVSASQVNFVLTMMDYNLAFAGNGNGACTITINYRARVESLGKNRLINVLSATPDELRRLDRLEDSIEHKIMITEEDREEARVEQAALLKDIRSNASKRFIDRLISKGSVYWRNVDLKEVLVSTLGKAAAKTTYEDLYDDDWLTNPPRHEDGLEQSLEILFVEGQADSLDTLPLVTFFENEEEDTAINGPEKIIYTFLGDVLQNTIDIATEGGGSFGAPAGAVKDMKLGLMDFRVGNKPYNIGDIPIEMGILMEFMQSKMGQKDIQTISIIDFINGILSEVITNRVGEYLNLKDGTTRSFKIGYNSQNKNLQPANEREYDLTDNKALRLIRKRPHAQELIIYSDSPLPTDFILTPETYWEKKKKDEDEGLHHFTMGSTKSLVKNISFDRVDLEYARERRLTINKEDPYALLKNVFNVNISMFGNDYFKPGSYIYVDPKVMGDLGAPYTEGSVANIMGLGGYHIVTKVKNSISDNSFDTTIDAVWETSGDGKYGMRSSKAGKEVATDEKDDK